MGYVINVLATAFKIQNNIILCTATHLYLQLVTACILLYAACKIKLTLHHSKHITIAINICCRYVYIFMQIPQHVINASIRSLYCYALLYLLISQLAILPVATQLVDAHPVTLVYSQLFGLCFSNSGLIQSVTNFCLVTFPKVLP